MNAAQHNTLPPSWRRRAWAVLGLLVAASGWMAWQALGLQFNYDFEQFFPADHPETTFYSEFRETFGSDNDFLIVGFEGEALTSGFLAEIDAQLEALEALPGVELVQSPTRLELPVRDPLSGMVFQRPLLGWDNDSTLTKDLERLRQRDDIMGTFVSPSGRAVALTMEHRDGLSKAGCDSLAAAVAEWEARLHETKSSILDIHVSGRAVAQAYYVGVMEREVAWFVSVGIVLLVAFLWFAFRTVWGILVPLTVVLMSGLWTLGIMVATGKAVDVMTVVLPTILFVVGISDVVHVLTRYYDERRSEATHEDAMRRSFREVGLATFLTSLTTALGFLTLLTSSIGPVHDFGVYAAVGVGVAYVLAFTLLPSVMVLAPPPVVSKQGSGVFWNGALHRALRWTLRNKAALAIAWVGIAGATTFLGSNLRVDNKLIEDLREDDPFRKQFAFFEREFAGVRPFELSVTLPDLVESPASLRALDALESHLKSDYGVGAIVGPATAVRMAHRGWMGDREEYYSIPQQASTLKKLLRVMKRSGQWNALVTEDGKGVRVFGKVEDTGSQVIQTKNDALDVWCEANLPEGSSWKVTGTAHLVDVNNASLASDMVGGLGLALIAVAIIAGLLFRSGAMVVLCLITNLLPLVMIAGVMVLMDVDLKVTSGIIFTVAFGIAVDDTIHFLSKLRLQLSQGRSLPVAVKRSFLATGKAIVVTSLILCGGFMTLTSSSFLGTFHIGFLISLTLLFAVVADLTFLPWMVLRWFKPKV
ncbi:MMPL family transporter [Flavobacteriales bacterium]|nr:MMPL family transporter [Flavobacteriales bacterium]